MLTTNFKRSVFLVSAMSNMQISSWYLTTNWTMVDGWEMARVCSRVPYVLLRRGSSMGVVSAVELGLERWMYLRLYNIWMKYVSDFLLRWSEGIDWNLFYIWQKAFLYADNPDPDRIVQTEEATRWRWGSGLVFRVVNTQQKKQGMATLKYKKYNTVNSL